MCGSRRIDPRRVLACRPCWRSLPMAARIQIMRKPRGNVRARAFFLYLVTHGLRTTGGNT